MKKSQKIRMNGSRIASAATLACAVLFALAATASAAPAASAKAAPVSTPSPSSPGDYGITWQSIPAVSTHDFVVGPGKIELSLQPGQSATVQLSVANRTGSDKAFSIGEEDFKGTDDPEQAVVLLGDDRGPYSLKDYMKIPVSAVLVPNDQKAYIPITITVPADAAPGGLYGSVVVAVATSPGSEAPAPGSATASNPIVTRIGTLFFVRVPGAVDQSGQLTGFSIAGGRTFFSGSQPLPFDLTYKNDGSVYLDPHGTIAVKNMLGATVSSIEVDPWFAMPASTRFREVLWNPPFLFGRYTAIAAIDRGYGSSTDVMSVSFWVIPWKIIAIIVAGLFVIIFGARWLLSKFKITRR